MKRLFRREVSNFIRLSSAIFATLNLLVSVPVAAWSADDPAPSPNRPIRDKWALVIGISEFENSKLNLRYSAKDAADFANYLTHEGGFAPDHVKVMLNKDATQRHILSELGNRWLPHVASPDDLVVIFISTHGSGADLDLGGQNYLIAYDTDVNELYASAIPMQQLAHDIRSRVHCDRVIIFLDACHSGATEPGARGLIRTGVDASEFSAGSGQLVIASSKDDQISWESKKLANGVFTAVLLDSLKKKGSSTTVEQMFTSLKDNVQDTVLRERGFLQTPVLKSQWSGNDIMIASKPSSPRPGLEEATGGERAGTPSVELPAPIVSPVSKPNKKKIASAVPMDRSRLPQAIGSPTPRAAETGSAYAPASASSSTTSVAQSSRRDNSEREPVSARVLIVPGKSVARMKLGMGTSEVTQLLGKPTYSHDNIFTYWTADRQYFLSVMTKDNMVSEIAFSSPAFKTESGISLSTYSNQKEKFLQKKASDDVMTLQGGGFKIAPAPAGTSLPIGVVYAAGAANTADRWYVAEASPQRRTTGTAHGASDRKSSQDDVNSAKDLVPLIPNTSRVIPNSTRAVNKVAPSLQDPDTLVQPGVMLAKIRLGVPREQVVALLGNAGDDKGSHMTYWTKDHKIFLTINLNNNSVSEIIFSSKIFATASGIKVSNFDSPEFASQMLPVKPLGNAQVFSLKQGGLSFVKRADGKSYGWLYLKDVPTAALPWTPLAP